MSAKDLLKNAVSGTGEAAKSVMDTATDLAKAGTADIEELFGAIIELGAEGVVDVTVGVKDVYVGSVNALKQSGTSTEDAVSEVTQKAELAIGKIGETGAGSVGGAARKGVEEAKNIVKEPFKK